MHHFLILLFLFVIQKTLLDSIASTRCTPSYQKILKFLSVLSLNNTTNVIFLETYPVLEPPC